MGRLATIDALRAFASVSVAYFHFTHGTVAAFPAGFLKTLGVGGWIGTVVFFVISGFIIPYSLHAQGYQPAQFLRFLSRRMLRIDPPYFVSIAIVLALGWLSTRMPAYGGQPFSVDLRTLAFHVGYLSSFLETGGLNPVYWSLGIEFQYYIAVGLLFPFLCWANWWTALVALGVACSFSVLFPSPLFLFSYGYAFSSGILTFNYKVNRLTTGQYLLLSGVPFLLGVFTLSWIHAVASLGTALLIAFINIPSYRVVNFLAAISYSLYLVHHCVGGRLMRFGEKFAAGWLSYPALLALAFVGSLLAATLLWRFVEVPSIALSRRIPLRKPTPDAARLDEAA